MAGYYPSETQIRPQFNPWYVGNVVVGGLIGLVIVDPLTGAVWNLHPTTIDRNLVPVSGNMTPDQIKAADEAANPPDKPKPVKSPKESSK